MSVLESGFANMSKEQKKSYFKDVAVMIHPDKNDHFGSNEAFVKL